MENPETVPRLVSHLAGLDGYPVLLNAAGIGVYAPFAELSWQDVERQANLNYLVPARLIHELIPLMLSRGGGRIVNVLSMVCEHVLPGCGAYASSKSALRMLGKVVSEEYRKKGIRVTNLMPGAVNTPIWECSPMQERTSEMIPLEAVAKTIQTIVDTPEGFNLDEILMMPPGGVL